MSSLPPPAPISHALPAGAWRRWRTHTDCNHGTWRGRVRAGLAELEYGVGRLDPFLQPDLGRFERLVFVCLGNINRSAFAEQVAHQQGLHCASVGLATTAGAPATHSARRLAPTLGFSLDAHQATPLQQWTRADTDLLLVMEARHARRLVAQGVPAAQVAMLGHYASPRRLHLHDPDKLSDAYFLSCFNLIRSAVEGLALELRRCKSPAARP
jgi:protein-tyrosine phosphatase